MPAQENLGEPPVFLLGAGASAEAGLPISREITRKVLDALSANRPLSRQASALNFVVASIIHHDSRQGGRADELPDIERVASSIELLAGRSDLEVSPFVSSWDPSVEAFEVGNPADSYFIRQSLEKAIVGRSQLTPRSKRIELKLAPDGRKLVTALEELIDQRTGGRYPLFRDLLNGVISHLARALSADEESVFDYLQPFAEISKAHKGLPILIGTLNYDLGIETMARRFDCEVDFGIESWLSQGSIVDSASHIRLIKLHGSLNWRRDKDLSGGLPATTCRVAPEGSKNGFTPFVVFGQREKLRAEGPFLELLEAYRRGLEQSTNLVIIGYSFRDSHINELIARWFNAAPQRRIVIVDPHFPQEPWSDDGTEFREALHRLADPKKYSIWDEENRPSPRVAIARQSASSFLSRTDPVNPNAQVDALFSNGVEGGEE